MPFKLFIFLFIPLASFSQTKVNLQLADPIGNEVKLIDSNLETGWFPGWDPHSYPAKVTFRFEPCNVTKIKIYDGYGQPKVKISNGSISVNEPLNLFMAWKTLQVNFKNVSELTFEIDKIDGEFPMMEIEVYSGSEEDEVEVIRYNGANVNGFHWIPQSKLIGSNVRLYQMFEWTWTLSGIAVEPTFRGNGNYDSYLTEAKNNGIDVVFCPNYTPQFLHPIDPNYKDARLHYDGVSAFDPLSYCQVSQYYFQIAARYGSVQYPASWLDVNQTPRWNGDEVNEIKSGLGLLNYLEVENEPDRPWNDNAHKYTPEQYAALLSAAYDGHEGRLGERVGIKTADKTMKVVMGGLSSINIAYLDRMLDWFENNRTDKKFPADVINVHHYCNQSNRLDSPDINLWLGAGIAPEFDDLNGRLSRLKKWVDVNCPNAEIWLSEIGYDTEPPSTNLRQYPKLYGNWSADDLQAMWTTRTALIAKREGIDKLFIYNGIDENSASKGYVFGSSGIMSGEVPDDGTDGFVPKKSWYELNWLNGKLQGFVFYKDISRGGVKIYVFRKKHQLRYFYWSPTANDVLVKFKVGNKELIATEQIQVYDSRSIFINPVPKSIKKVGVN